MYDVIITILIVVTFVTLVWHYERKTVRLELDVDAQTELIDELVRENKALRAQVIDQQRIIARPFKTETLHDHVNSALAVAAHSDNVIPFTRAEIEEWN